MRRDARVGRIGLTVLVGLSLFIGAVWIIGDKSRLFANKVDYTVQFRNVTGLSTGSPVQLNGVDVGQVEDILLPEDSSIRMLQVRVSVEERYSGRIRQDSLARIKSFGLLGDKYVEITTGSPDSPEVPPGGEITTARQTDVDALIQSGEDVADDLVSTARSLSRILARMDRGDGLLGQIVSDEGSRDLSERVNGIAVNLESLTARLDRGEGTLGALMHSDQLIRSLEQTLERTNSVLAQFETGEGLLPALIQDPAYKERFDDVLVQASAAMQDVRTVTREITEGEGLLPTLLKDAELAEQLIGELTAVIESLGSVAEKLDRGEGTAAQLINDPAVYDAVNDILVGVDESKILRWLIRNRQKAGIEKRARDAGMTDPDL